MARVKLVVDGFRCERCGWEWIPSTLDLSFEPNVCPKCKSPFWDRPRKNKLSKTRTAKQNINKRFHKPVTREYVDKAIAETMGHFTDEPD